MSSRIPILLRAAMRLERLAAALYRRCAGLTQHVALRRVPAALRPDVTAAIYSTQRSYGEAGARFESGLFPWERAAFAHPRFPRCGTVLVGGAGGGREVAALARSGYSVLAFEPAEGLLRAAERTVTGLPGCEVLRGSYEELSAALRGARTSLDRVVAAAPFDAVVLGWGSFSHLLEHSDRCALLATLRRLAPSGPIVLSYFSADGAGRTGDDGSHLPDGSIRFAAHAGYYRTMSRDDLEALAEGAGYDVALSSSDPYPHALLVPRPAAQEPATASD